MTRMEGALQWSRGEVEAVEKAEGGEGPSAGAVELSARARSNRQKPVACSVRDRHLRSPFLPASCPIGHE